MTSQFERDGYAVSPTVIPRDEIERLRSEAEAVRGALLIQTRIRRSTDSRITWWRLDDGHPYLLKIKPVIDLAPTAHSIATSTWMTERIGALLGAAPILMEDKFMYKERLNEDITWTDLPILGEEVRKHTDADYFTRRGYGRVLTVAVCLDDCTAASGALRVWPGTHQRDIRTTPTTNQGPVVLDEDAQDTDAVMLEAPTGSVLVWESRLVHASEANVSHRPRRLLVLGFTAGSQR